MTQSHPTTQVHFEFFCDKLVASFCPRYHECLWRCKRISPAGSRQLLLDTQVLRAMLLELPGHGRGGPSPAFAAYVGRELGKSEALLKVRCVCVFVGEGGVPAVQCVSER